MEVCLCSLLLLVATIGLLFRLTWISASHGDQMQQENRLHRRLDRFCDELEDFYKVLARKRDSLEKHAVHLRLLADDMQKTHTEATKGKAFWSGVAVGGNIIKVAGLVWDFFGKGSPYISAVGKGIAKVGGYRQEMVCSSEQEQWIVDEKNVSRVFKEIEEELREITDLYYEIEKKLHDLEEEDGLLGTRLHKKLQVIKTKFSRFKPFKIERNYVDLKSQLFDLVLTLAKNTGAIDSVMGTFQGTAAADDKVSTGEKISTSDGVSGTKLKVASDKFQVAPRKNHFTNSKNVLKAATAAASLYQDGKKLYKGILNLNKGARSELAENISEVAAYLESVIEKLDSFRPKRSTRFESPGSRKRKATDL